MAGRCLENRQAVRQAGGDGAHLIEFVFIELGKGRFKLGKGHRAVAVKGFDEQVAQTGMAALRLHHGLGAGQDRPAEIIAVEIGRDLGRHGLEIHSEKQGVVQAQ
ncbi:MAG: hypothetical protein BWY83_01377 [bacterium ADurb.Bin478]|nr:MAG: hypothetical protein BWY83_01377 [bacterium ADurb.Bin478]